MGMRVLAERLAARRTRSACRFRRAALALALALAALPATLGCTDDGGTGPDPGDSSAHAFCVQETNRYRTMKSRPEVARSTQLETYADTGAMIDFNGAPHDHFRSTSGGGIAFAENECPK